MLNPPKTFDELLDYHDSLLDQRDAASNQAERNEIDAKLGLVKSAIRRAALADLSRQADILSKLARDLEQFTHAALAWPFGDLRAPRDHEIPHREELPDNDFQDEGPDAPPPTPTAVGADVIPRVSAGWAANYRELWDSLVIRAGWENQTTAIANKIIANQSRYVSAVEGTAVPWWFVGVVHSMECSLRFDQHLHNGDPLTARTNRIPKDRPAHGRPPYSWEESARDAIEYDRLLEVTDWSLESALYHWHRYNGINNEYKRRGIPTPYLWSGSTHYRKGKYVKDGVFDPEAVSKQVGAALLLYKLIALNAITVSEDTLKENPVAAIGDSTLISLKLEGKAFEHVIEELRFPGALKSGAGGSGAASTERANVRKVQEWLTLNECATAIDSDFGPSTERQLQRFCQLNGQPETSILNESIWALLTKPMRAALATIDFPHNTSLEKAMVAVAQQHISQSPKEVGGENRGPWVRLYMARRDGPSQRWCAGFVSFIAAQMSRDLDVPLPFQRRVSVDSLVNNAKQDGRFVRGAHLTTAAQRLSHISPGHLFVIRKTSTDWTHVGIVLGLENTTFDTLEGNTSGEGGVDGEVAREYNRSYNSKDFLKLQ